MREEKIKNKKNKNKEAEFLQRKIFFGVSKFLFWNSITETLCWKTSLPLIFAASNLTRILQTDAIFDKNSNFRLKIDRGLSEARGRSVSHVDPTRVRPCLRQLFDTYHVSPPVGNIFQTEAKPIRSWRGNNQAPQVFN